jgi:hypothetical protein
MLTIVTIFLEFFGSTSLSEILWSTYLNCVRNSYLSGWSFKLFSRSLRKTLFSFWLWLCQVELYITILLRHTNTAYWLVLLKIIHEFLKLYRNIFEAERHSHVFGMSIGIDEDSFWRVAKVRRNSGDGTCFLSFDLFMMIIREVSWFRTLTTAHGTNRE